MPADAGIEPRKRITLASSRDFAAWLMRAADHSRLGMATFVEMAAIEKAKAAGFDEPPPRRRNQG